MGVAEDGGAEAEEGFVKDDGVNERSVGEVDLREGVVEASEGVAQESAGGLGEELIPGFHIEDDGGGWVGGVWFPEDGGDEGEYEIPVRLKFMTLYYVELTFDVVTSVHPAEDCFGRVALTVVDEDASVEEFARL